MSKITKVTVDRDVCIGAMSCVLAAGSVFELDEDNKSVIKLKDGVRNSGPADRAQFEDLALPDDAILAAAQSCPVRAIILHDETGQQLYP
jgi:ferredoxin